MYSSGQVDVLLHALAGAAIVDLTSTGDKARWNPGAKKGRIRRLYVALNAIPGDAGVIKWDKRPTFGSDTARGDGDVGVVNLATTHLAGGIIYKDVNIQINPGQEVVVEATDASAAVNAARVGMLVEYDEEQPANIPAMVAST